MRERLIQEDFDIIHSHGLWMGTNSIPTVFMGRNNRVVLSPRGMLAGAALRYSPLKKAVARVAFQNRALKAVSLFHATCEEEYREIRRFGLHQPVAVIPNGVDPMGPGDPQRVGKTVLYLGRVHPKKGADILVEAWSRVASEFPGWTLKIAGPFEAGFEDVLKRMVCERKLESVEFLGECLGSRKETLFRESSVFVLPTKNENFGLAIAESLGAGTPVITTKGAPWEGLEKYRCGWWIDHGVAPLTEALRMALTVDRAERQAMGGRGYDWVSEAFSWEAVAQQMADAYRWLLRTGPKPFFIREG